MQTPRRLLLLMLAFTATSTVAAQSPPPPQRLVDSIANFLTFVPVGESTFVAAARGKRLLLDIGRVDAEVRRDSSKAAAYRAAVAERSPVKPGTRFRLHASWGEEDVIADSVSSWNGRVTLSLHGSAALDSAASAKQALTAAVTASAAPLPPKADSCARASLVKGSPLALRAIEVRDSLTLDLRNGPQPLYDRLRKKMTVVSSQAVGCYGSARVAILVSLRAAGNEWVREKLVLVDTLGKANAIRINDLRFRGHELLHAVDVDGDGVDDLATRAVTEHAGATTLLRLDLKAKRLTRFAAGFAWEDQ